MDTASPLPRRSYDGIARPARWEEAQRRRELAAAPGVVARVERPRAVAAKPPAAEVAPPATGGRLPDLLAAWRARCGMSAERLGFLAGVDRTLIGRYESGQRTPRVTTVARLVDVLAYGEREAHAMLVAALAALAGTTLADEELA